MKRPEPSGLGFPGVNAGASIPSGKAAEAAWTVRAPYAWRQGALEFGIVKLAYARPRPVMIRTLELIHLASATVGKASSLVATDARLRELGL